MPSSGIKYAAERLRLHTEALQIQNEFGLNYQDAMETAEAKAKANSAKTKDELINQIQKSALSGVAHITAHKLRRNSLDAPILKAIGLAGNREVADVYVQLKELAIVETAPLTGVTDDGAIEYTNDDNQKAKLTKDALAKRIKRL